MRRAKKSERLASGRRQILVFLGLLLTLFGQQLAQHDSPAIDLRKSYEETLRCAWPSNAAGSGSVHRELLSSVGRRLTGLADIVLPTQFGDYLHGASHSRYPIWHLAWRGAAARASNITSLF